MAGPAFLEDDARAQLEVVLYEALSQCRYLNHSQRDAVYAGKLARQVRYQIKGSRVVVGVHLDVEYRNPPGRWKPWAAIRTDLQSGVVANTIEPGTGERRKVKPKPRGSEKQ